MVEEVIAYQKQRGDEGQHQQRSHAEGGKKDGETSQDAKEIDGKGGVDLVVVVGGDLAVGQMVGQGKAAAQSSATIQSFSTADCRTQVSVTASGSTATREAGR